MWTIYENLTADNKKLVESDFQTWKSQVESSYYTEIDGMDEDEVEILRDENSEYRLVGYGTSLWWSEYIECGWFEQFLS